MRFNTIFRHDDESGWRKQQNERIQAIRDYVEAMEQKKAKKAAERKAAEAEARARARRIVDYCRTAGDCAGTVAEAFEQKIGELIHEAALTVTALQEQIAGLEKERDEARAILTRDHSLPHDWTFIEVVQGRLDDIAKLKDQVRDTCARAEKAEASGVRVKKLEWNPYRAETLFGYYHIDDQTDRPGEVLEGRDPFLLSGSRLNLSRHPSLVAARAAAQADYERRILSALEPSPSAGVNAEVLDRAIRWWCVEHEHDARTRAAAAEHPCTLTPLYASPSPAPAAETGVADDWFCAAGYLSIPRPEVRAVRDEETGG